MSEERAHAPVETIVVPLDGSEVATRALAPARALAERLDALVVLVTTHWDEGVGAAQEHLDRHAMLLDLRRVETVVVHDHSAADAILMHAADRSAVVCMSTHGRSGLGQVFLGSVGEEVVRASKHPVVLIGPDVDLSLSFEGGLLAGVDGSKLAEASVPTVHHWAEALDLEPVFVQVLPAGKEIVATPQAEESAYVRELARSFSDERPADWRVLHALDAADALVGEAHRSRAAVIALTTHGRTGLRRVVLGSVAARIVHRSSCPVLVTPAPGG